MPTGCGQKGSSRSCEWVRARARPKQLALYWLLGFEETLPSPSWFGSDQAPPGRFGSRLSGRAEHVGPLCAGRGRPSRVGTAGPRLVLRSTAVLQNAVGDRAVNGRSGINGPLPGRLRGKNGPKSLCLVAGRRRPFSFPPCSRWVPSIYSVRPHDCPPPALADGKDGKASLKPFPLETGSHRHRSGQAYGHETRRKLVGRGGFLPVPLPKAYPSVPLLKHWR